MNGNRDSSGSGGLLVGLLGLLFVGLKLGGVIDWPWLWVLAPFWIPVALVVVFGLLALVCIGIATALDPKK